MGSVKVYNVLGYGRHYWENLVRQFFFFLLLVIFEITKKRIENVRFQIE